MTPVIAILAPILEYDILYSTLVGDKYKGNIFSLNYKITCMSDRSFVVVYKRTYSFLITDEVYRGIGPPTMNRQITLCQVHFVGEAKLH